MNYGMDFNTRSADNSGSILSTAALIKSRLTRQTSMLLRGDIAYHTTLERAQRRPPRSDVKHMEKLPEFIANHLFLVTLFISLAALLLWNISSGAVGAPQISPQEAVQLINREHAKVLDLRSDEEFAGGHIINAVNETSAALMDDNADQLQRYRGQPLILCCRHGRDSQRVAHGLKKRGVDKLYCLKGGISAWHAANLPLAAAADSPS